MANYNNYLNLFLYSSKDAILGPLKHVKNPKSRNKILENLSSRDKKLL